MGCVFQIAHTSVGPVFLKLYIQQHLEWFICCRLTAVSTHSARLQPRAAEVWRIKLKGMSPFLIKHDMKPYDGVEV
jgi:hypothetical protein